MFAAIHLVAINILLYLLPIVSAAMAIASALSLKTGAYGAFLWQAACFVFCSILWTKVKDHVIVLFGALALLKMGAKLPDEK